MYPKGPRLLCLGWHLTCPSDLRSDSLLSVLCPQKEVGALLCAPALSLCQHPICYSLLKSPAFLSNPLPEDSTDPNRGDDLFICKLLTRSIVFHVQCKLSKYLINEWISFVIFQPVKVGLKGEGDAAGSHHLPLLTEAGRSLKDNKFQGISAISLLPVNPWCLSAWFNTTILSFITSWGITCSVATSRKRLDLRCPLRGE